MSVVYIWKDNKRKCYCYIAFKNLETGEINIITLYYFPRKRVTERFIKDLRESKPIGLTGYNSFSEFETDTFFYSYSKILCSSYQTL